MKVIIKLISFILVVVLISGCAIKKSDSTATKILKHTANSPIYVLIGTAFVLNIKDKKVK